MRIPMATAVGRGPTTLAAFDAALVTAGIADRNLIYLSSVLPPGSDVDRVPRLADTPGDWGDRLYCVMAEARTDQVGTEVWAGVGWVQDDTGRGLLVEHHAHDRTTLEALVSDSLDGLCRNRGLQFPRRGMAVEGTRCTGEPVSALVVAVFESAAWQARRLPARQRVHA